LYGLLGSILGATISHYLHEPAADINIGLFSFNSVLCAIAFTGNKPKDGLFVLIAIVLSVFIDVVMLKNKVNPLTFPFVLASWITLLVKALFDRIRFGSTRREVA
ncbi:MAG: urea transporter, partial [Bacteroidota bacterium]|nr:urea transporter [Bacteroidota bacterium]